MNRRKLLPATALALIVAALFLALWFRVGSREAGQTDLPNPAWTGLNGSGPAAGTAPGEDAGARTTLTDRATSERMHGPHEGAHHLTDDVPLDAVAGPPVGAAAFSIEGQTVTEDGAPLAGVRIEVFPYEDTYLTHQALALFQQLGADRTPLATGASDRDGVFSVPIAEAGRYRVHARQARRTSAEEGPIQVDATSPRPYLLLAMPPGYGLAGVVFDPAGRPLPGVDLSLLDRLGGIGAFASRRTTTDGGGGFRFDGLEARSYILMARPHGLAGRILPQVEAPTEGLEVHIVDAHELLGQVIDADTREAVAGALITALNPISYDQVESAADGSFSLRLAGPDADLLVRHPRYVLHERRIRLAPSSAGQGFPAGDPDPARRDEDLLITLERGEELRGRVLREDGSPCAGVEVGVFERAGWLGDLRTTRTDADGRFALDAVSNLELPLAVARVPGWAQVAPTQLPLPDTEQHLILHPTPTLTGRVVDPVGRPLPGAWIVLHPAGPPELQRVARWLRGVQETWTDAHGAFALADVIPDLPVRLQVSHPGYADQQLDLEPLAATLAGGPLEVVLGTGGSVEIAISSPAGRARPSTLVIAQWHAGAPITRRPSGTLQGGVRYVVPSDGVLTIDGVPAGPAVFHVVAPPYLEERIEVAVDENARHRLTVDLRESARLTVRVVDAAGTPRPALRVTVLPEPPTGAPTGTPTPPASSRSARTDSTGAILFLNLPPGRCDLHLEGPGGRVASRTVQLTEGAHAHEEIVLE